DLITSQTLADSTIIQPTRPAPTEFAAVLRTLLVEDNPVNQSVAKSMLEKLGCRVDVAANGREALEMLQTLPYQIVFMDCQMPEMDGYEATSAWRRRERPGQRLPIIAMTAHAMAGDREKCLAAGMDDYLSKPVRLADLQDVLARWMRREPPAAAAKVSAPETPRESPLLDLSVVDNLRSLADDDAGTDLFADLLNMFRDSTTGGLVELRQAVRDQDPKTLTMTAHTLKGSSANLGARQMTQVCRQLEILGKSGSVA